MDYNRAYKALYLYHIEERQSLNYISDETGLSPKQIRQLAKGSLYPTVYLHFMKDRKTEDFSREYPHKTKKLKDSALKHLREDCINQIIHLGADLRDVRSYLLEQDFYENDVNKIIKSLAKDYGEDIEREKRNKINMILDVLKMPTKFGIDYRNKIIELYPHPKLNQYYFTIGVEYKPFRSYKMPDDLFDYYCTMERMEKKKPSVRDQWVNLHNQGIAIYKIAKQYGVSHNTVKRHLTKVALSA